MDAKTFGDPKKTPSESDLRERVGKPFLQVEEVLSVLQAEFQNLSCEWKFSKNSGWYIVYNRGKKRLFYLFPTDGDFLLKVVFNDRALVEIRTDAFSKHIHDMLRDARKYSEGTLFEFSNKRFNVATMIELFKIKIST